MQKVSHVPVCIGILAVFSVVTMLAMAPAFTTKHEFACTSLHLHMPMFCLSRLTQTVFLLARLAEVLTHAQLPLVWAFALMRNLNVI